MVAITLVFILHLLLWHLCNSGCVRHEVAQAGFEHFLVPSRWRSSALLRGMTGELQVQSFTPAASSLKPLLLLHPIGTAQVQDRSKTPSVNFRKFTIFISFGSLWYFGVFSFEGQGNADWRSVLELKCTRWQDLLCFSTKSSPVRHGTRAATW